MKKFKKIILLPIVILVTFFSKIIAYWNIDTSTVECLYWISPTDRMSEREIYYTILKNWLFHIILPLILILWIYFYYSKRKKKNNKKNDNLKNK